jgi:hypothetical protein
MAQLTVGDLKEFPSFYDSSRSVGDVLVGEDTASLLIEASLSGNNMAVQNLLSQPQWTKIMFEKPHRIYNEGCSCLGPNHVRQVSAMSMSNLEWALSVAALHGQAAVVSTLTAFAKRHGIDVPDVVTKMTMIKIIQSGHAAVVKALAQADPKIINMALGHGGTLPIYKAVRLRQTEVVAVLLEFGADTLHPVISKTLGTYNSSLMSLAAMAETPRMTELLLDHGTPIAHTGALHTAARFGHLDTMRLLMQHGADANEVLANWKGWTPMHFAASRGKIDSMKLLERSEARSDLADEDGKTPAQLLEELNTA